MTPSPTTHATPSGQGIGPSDSCGDFGMRIARDGTWHHDGAPIGRAALVKLFASVLRREADGTYWLVTPAERGRIAVEDAPFVAVALDALGEGRDQILRFTTNVDDTVDAGQSHPLRIETDRETEEPRPYVLVRDGLEARLLRPVFYQLVALGRDETIDGVPAFGVWSNGQFFPLGSSTTAI